MGEHKKVIVEAICPGCKKKFKVKLGYEWKGRGVMKKRCIVCSKGEKLRGIETNSVLMRVGF